MTFNHKVLGSNLRLHDEWSNRKTSPGTGFYRVDLESFLRPTIIPLYLFRKFEATVCLAWWLKIFHQSGGHGFDSRKIKLDTALAMVQHYLHVSLELRC